MRLLLALILAYYAYPTPIGPRADAPDDIDDLDVAQFLIDFNSTLIKYGGDPLPTIPGIDTSEPIAKLRRRASGIGYTPLTPSGVPRGISSTGQGARTQHFQTIYDTGTADYYVPGPTCNLPQGCNGQSKYNQGGLYEGTQTVLDRTTHGDNYRDNVTVGGLTAEWTNVISLTSVFPSREGYDGSSAVMGLGLGPTKSGHPSFLQDLMNQKQVAAPEFSFYFGRRHTQTENLSQLSIGGRIDSPYDKDGVVRIPLLARDRWSIGLGGVKVNGLEVYPQPEGGALIDTTCSQVMMPPLYVAAVFKKVPGSIGIPIGGNDLNVSAVFSRTAGYLVALERHGQCYRSGIFI